MKAQIVYNPTAGKGRHSQKEVEEFVSKGDFSRIRTVSTNQNGWEKFDRNRSDVIFVAGGDGTVHKVAKVLQNRKKQDSQTPIHILPMGTANNISKTLGVGSSFLTHRFNTEKQLQKFDVGKVKGLKDHDFFLEAVGAGIFPALVSRMQSDEVVTRTKSEKLKHVLKILLEVVQDFKAQRAVIKTDGISISGSFLLVEVMNIQYIGPNFELAPKANPGDGYFDLVLIPEEKRAQLLEYIQKMIDEFADEENLKDVAFSMRVKNIEIRWEDSNVHVDDDLIPDFTGGMFVVSADPGRLRFVRNP